MPRTLLVVVLTLLMRLPVLAQPAIVIENPTPGLLAGFGVAALGGDLLVARLSGGTIHVFDPNTRAELRTFTAPGGFLGFSLAVAGPWLVAGDPGGPLLDGVGQVVVFDAASGTILHTLANPAPDMFDDFGWSVAVAGGYVAVGTPFDDTAGSQAGAVYVFDGASGALVQTLFDPTPGADELFGRQVAAVGSNVLVSSLQDDTAGPNAGAAYLFDPATGALLRTFLPPPGTPVQFGEPVAALGADALVGGRTAVHVYDPSTGAILRTFLPPAGAEFGQLIATSGNTVILSGQSSATAMMVFDGTTTALLRTIANPVPALGEGITSFALVDGNVVAGSPSKNTVEFGNAGAVFVFCGGTAGCGPCETCGPSSTCVVAPSPTCRTPSGSGRSLQIRNGSPDTADAVRWTGNARVIRQSLRTAEFGQPDDAASGNDFSMCLYDESGPTPSLLFRATAPAGGDCAGRPCWRRTAPSLPVYLNRGFVYQDTDETPDGLSILRLQTRDPSLGTLTLKGVGPNLSNRPLGLPALPLALPVRAQLQVRNGLCWEATYSSAKVNTTTRFRASSDPAP